MQMVRYVSAMARQIANAFGVISEGIFYFKIGRSDYKAN
jgi:hypothetical protein